MGIFPSSLNVQQRLLTRAAQQVQWINRFSELGAEKKSKAAGESACATTASPVLPMVGQAVLPASAACGRFFLSFLPSGSWHGAAEQQK